MLARNDQPTKVDGESIDWRALGAKPFIELSEINRRCRSVLSVDSGSVMDYSIIATTMRARKLRTCQLGMWRWSVGRWPTSARKRTSFHGGLSLPRSNDFRFVSRTPGCWYSWVQLFPVPLEKIVGAAEWAVLVPFSDSCSLSGTGR